MSEACASYLTDLFPPGPKAEDPDKFKLTYKRPDLADYQFRAIFSDARAAWIEATTKSGKTHACLIWQWEKVAASRDGWNHWWLAPYQNTARIAYTRAKKALREWITEGVVVPHDSEKWLAVRLGEQAGGGWAYWWFKSGEIPDALYGEDVYSAVIDEASRFRETSWHAVRSTLTATRAPLRAIGNVRGKKNWHYRACRKAQSGSRKGHHYAKITALDAVNAGILNADEIREAKEDLPHSVYRELYFAEASDDGSNPFGLEHIAAILAPLAPTSPRGWGWDLAKAMDWTVGIALDDNGAGCRFLRWQKPWEECEEDILAETGDDPAQIDSTGVGDPVVERLQRKRPNIQGFNFGARERNLGGFDKQKLMERLRTAIRNREITIPDGPIRQELDSFEFVYTRNGVRYSAPEGMHDDCVMALALAVHCCTAVENFDAVGAYIPTAPSQEELREMIAERQRLHAEILAERAGAGSGQARTRAPASTTDSAAGLRNGQTRRQRLAQELDDWLWRGTR